MRVAVLLGFLRSLSHPLEALGANAKHRGDLDAACKLMEHFGEHSVEQLSGYLRMAEEFERTGVRPAHEKPAPKPRAPKSTTPKLSVVDAVEKLRAFYSRVNDPDVEPSHIDAEVESIKSMTAADLGKVAEGFDLVKGRTKDASLKAIRDKLHHRKQSFLRTQF